MNTEKSRKLFEEAKKYIPGGVNSPVRAFKSVGGDPLFVTKGRGSKFWDADGSEYIDYIGSWEPHLFGHNPPFIIDALKAAIENGTSFGAPTAMEVEMAKLITELVPSVEMVRMVNSGTEATMSAVRAARGYTGREKFIKFEGCYHGHADYFLIALVSYLTGGGYVLLCPDEANVNASGIVDLGDLSAMVSYLTGGGYVLPSCQ